MIGAGEALTKAAVTRIGTVGALTSVHAGAPIQAALPFAIVEAGLEIDWSHKTGVGREVRLSIHLRDGGERRDRLRRLMAEAESRVAEIEAQIDGWRIVSLIFQRSRIAGSPGEGWSAILDYRARMLALAGG